MAEDGEGEGLNDFVVLIRQGLRKHGLEAATALVARTSRRPDLAAKAAALIQAEAVKFGLLKDPPAIERRDLERWYSGPSAEDQYWPAVRTYVEAKWNNVEAVDELDKASTKIVSDFGNPHGGDFSLRGLVAGDVQSGKTSNFTAVIAKAADAGYCLFIVLSGTKNKLRKQTQQRLNLDLVERDLTGWMWLTSDDLDFSQSGRSNAAQVLARAHSQPVIMVVKKIKSRLQRLADWLEFAPPDLRKRLPAVVVDDEADEASINTQKAKNKRAAVNAGILRILTALPKVTFVGYTATPYANFLIDAGDEEDLYPRDFIVPLKSGADYFGYERIFGRERTRFDESDEDIDGLDMIRPVPAAEADKLRDIGLGKSKLALSQLTSLRDAIEWFALATAARFARGQAGEHSSMLIHTSQRTAIHQVFRKPVKDWCTELRSAVVANQEGVKLRLKLMWEREQAAVPPTEFKNPQDSIEKVLSHLPDVLKRLRVIVENSMEPSEERLVYGEEPGVYVVIGGDVLSRGLTLEGLVCSFFTRSASAFDTLMQMGRWFGYRRGFEDLPRIWMTSELQSNFYEMGGIDRELRQLIQRVYSGTVTPRQYAPMMRKHPRLAITSRMKMQGPHVVREYSYGDRRVQTILFKHKDKAWLDANADATRTMLEQATQVGAKKSDSDRSGYVVVRGVPVELILQFIGSYQVHENSVDLNRDALVDYIQAEVAANSLRSWNIVVVQGAKGPGAKTTVLADGFKVRNLIRSRIKGDATYANIKSLMSQEDVAADFPSAIPGAATFDDVIAERNKINPKIGLLVLYPIDPTSSPANARSRVRVNLDAAAPVIGLGLVFPRAESGREHARYIQLKLPDATVESPDEEDDEEDGE